MASAAGEEEPKWILVQKKGFTKWANVYLGMRKRRIEDLYTDFNDGVNLIHLLEVIGQEPIGRKWVAKPKMRIQRLENVGTALKYLTKRGVQLTNCSPNDIVDGNGKIILGMMWTVISKFQVGDIKLEGVSGKDGLLLWVKRQVSSYEGVKVKDFAGSFKNGMVLCALLHHHRPASIPWDTLDKENKHENLAIAFEAAKKYFGVEPLFDPEDIADVRRPDEKIIICYVSFLFQAIAEMAKQDALVKSIHKAMDITRRHDEWIRQYNEQASALNAWLETSKATYGGSVEGNTLDTIRTTLDAFYEYRRTTKAAERAKFTSLKGLLNTLVSSQRNNNRPAYTPEGGLGPDDVQAQWVALQEVENAYEVRVRERYAHFEHLENTLARFHVTANKVQTWVNKQMATFESGETGNSVTAVETLQEAFKAYEEQRAHYGLVLELLESMTVNEGMEEHASQPQAVERLAEVTGMVASMDEAATAYSEALAASLEKHQQLVGQIKQYNSKATDFEFTVVEYQEELSEPIPTTSLQAVDTTIATFEEQAPEKSADIAARYDDIMAIATALQEQDADAFKRFPVSRITELKDAAEASVEARRGELSAAKEVEEHKEDLRKTFATHASAAKQFCEAKLAAVGSLTGSLEDQLAAVQGLQNTVAEAKASVLVPVQTASDALGEAGVVNNSHTAETIHSITAVWGEMLKSFERAAESLKGQIIAAKSGDVTPEQIKEIKEVFEYFDVDGDAQLDPKEFHSCATGIGLVLTDEQVKENFDSIDTSGDGFIDFDEFTTFMVGVLREPGYAKNDVMSAFDELAGAGSEGTMTDEQVKRFFMNFPEDIKYLTAHMKEAGTDEDGAVVRNTNDFVDDIFTR